MNNKGGSLIITEVENGFLCWIDNPTKEQDGARWVFNDAEAMSRFVVEFFAKPQPAVNASCIGERGRFFYASGNTVNFSKPVTGWFDNPHAGTCNVASALSPLGEQMATLSALRSALKPHPTMGLEPQTYTAREKGLWLLQPGDTLCYYPPDKLGPSFHFNTSDVEQVANFDPASKTPLVIMPRWGVGEQEHARVQSDAIHAAIAADMKADAARGLSAVVTGEDTLKKSGSPVPIVETPKASPVTADVSETTASVVKRFSS